MRVTVDIDFFKHSLRIRRKWVEFNEFMEKYYDKLFKKWKNRFYRNKIYFRI